MTYHVEIPLPDHLYQQLGQWANARQQKIGEVIAEAIADYLVDTLLQESLPDSEIAPEREAFLRLHPDLWEKYPGEYAAVCGGKLVDHDADKIALLQRIEQQYPEQFVLVRQVREEPEIVYEHHSVRWLEETR